MYDHNEMTEVLTKKCYPTHWFYNELVFYSIGFRVQNNAR